MTELTLETVSRLLVWKFERLQGKHKKVWRSDFAVLDFNGCKIPKRKVRP